MTHDQALAAFDAGDNMFRAGVKIRMFHALKARNADLWNSDDDGRKAIVAAEMVNAVDAEMRRAPLPEDLAR